MSEYQPKLALGTRVFVRAEVVRFTRGGRYILVPIDEGFEPIGGNFITEPERFDPVVVPVVGDAGPSFEAEEEAIRGLIAAGAVDEARGLLDALDVLLSEQQERLDALEWAFRKAEAADAHTQRTKEDRR